MFLYISCNNGENLERDLKHNWSLTPPIDVGVTVSHRSPFLRYISTGLSPFSFIVDWKKFNNNRTNKFNNIYSYFLTVTYNRI